MTSTIVFIAGIIGLPTLTIVACEVLEYYGNKD